MTLEEAFERAGRPAKGVCTRAGCDCRDETTDFEVFRAHNQMMSWAQPPCEVCSHEIAQHVITRSHAYCCVTGCDCSYYDHT